ncbi:hypothetical protein COCOBI_02-3100 [Coccomyxa sp. Obi]|nr:hypothetical protein COCOBI_02-3100 [Coccomyxa sp. Obi]
MRQVLHGESSKQSHLGAGEIWVDKTDVERLAKKIHVQREIFLSRYVKSYSRKPGYWLLRNTNGTQDCIFLRGTECIVNDAKPLQCRTYPYWPELMDPEAWKAERSDMCEGIDHEEAPEIDIEKAALQLQASTEFFARRDGLL